ncbi:MAG: 16S rRNA (guanine(966)-N(2))-methyltransferase RsmD [Porticoccaceae bacterium]|nr:16S rRNA (guanine(966)-N(2))-methyltransferase RsmD [Porticoccaceae bacterium]
MATKQQIRIIAGKWRSRQLRFPDIPGLRPTGDRIRETLFNWLAPNISGSRCVDLFSGSGALCFEALSRGAVHCLALEQHPKAITCLTESKSLLNASELTIAHKDTLQYLQQSPDKPYDIVFVDPPFDLNLINQVCSLLEANNWIASGGAIYCELPVEQKNFAPPANWQVLRNKATSGVNYILFSRIEPKA